MSSFSYKKHKMEDAKECLCLHKTIPAHLVSSNTEVKLYINFLSNDFQYIEFEDKKYEYKQEMIFYVAKKNAYKIKINSNTYKIKKRYNNVYSKTEAFIYIMSKTVKTQNIDKINCGLIVSCNNTNMCKLAANRYNEDTNEDYNQNYNKNYEEFYVVGHRGYGKNMYHQNISYQENTYAAFQQAQKMGVKWAELDVQLTKDKTPVIYHDFVMNQNNKKIQIAEIKDTDFFATKSYDMSTNKYEFRLEDLQNISLEELLDKCHSLNLNIEIKYPNAKEREENNITDYLEVDVYCNYIWQIVRKYKKEKRRIIFSSFVKKVCKYLRLIQDVYDVYFLAKDDTEIIDNKNNNTCNSTVSYKYETKLQKDECNAIDSLQNVRNSLAYNKIDALLFCIKYDLHGVVYNSKYLMNDCKCIIKQAHAHNKKVFLYGEETNQEMHVHEFIKAGVDGLICNEIDKVIRLRKNKKLNE
ncbi:Glycerophosphocholine phosphodiesterase gpcpd1 [Binucleata daphniae]